jgi:toxin CcdB
MAQFDLYENPDGGLFPLLLDVQTALLSRLATRVVVPLAKLRRYGHKPISRLNPTIRFGGVEYVLVFQELAAVTSSSLGGRVGSLDGQRRDIIAALDLLFTGI